MRCKRARRPAPSNSWCDLGFSTLVDSGLSLQVVVAVVLDAPGAALSLVRNRAGPDLYSKLKKFIAIYTRLLGGEIYS